MWRVAADILNKVSRTVDKRWCSSVMVGRGRNLKSLMIRSGKTSLGLASVLCERPEKWKSDVSCGNGNVWSAN